MRIIITKTLLLFTAHFLILLILNSSGLGQTLTNHEPTELKWQKYKTSEFSNNNFFVTGTKLREDQISINYRKQFYNEVNLINKLNDISDLQSQNWTKVIGPEGGNVRRFYKYYDSLYALTEREIYIYRTDKWEPMNFEEIICNNIQCLYVDSTGRMLAGTDFQILTSSDRGKNWVSVSGELSSSAINDFIELDGQNILIAADKGIYKKQVYEDSYVKLESNLINVLTLTFETEDKIWAGTADGVYKANYPELIWTRVNIDSSHYPDILINKRGTIYARNGYYLCKSTDKGETWEYMSGIFFTDIILEGDSDLVATDFFKFLRINENGVYWISSSIDKVLLTTYINNENEFYVGAMGSGAYKYNITKNIFSNFTEGLQSATIRAIEILKNKTIFTITDANTFYLSYNGGKDWIPKREGWSRCTKQDAEGNLYVAHGSGLIKSTDYGESWVILAVEEEPFYINAMDISDDGKTICVGYSSGDVHISTNKGDTFRKILHRNYSWVESIEILSDGTIMIQRDSLYYTLDNGITLNIIQDDRLFATAMIQDNDRYIYMSSYPGIYRSEKGLHWTYLSSSKFGSPQSFKLDSLNNVYALFSGGTVLKTQDKGESWKTVANPIYFASSWSFDLDNSGNMYCGTQELGLYYCKISIEKEEEKIVAYKLSNNYPNPFNNSTRIDYEVPNYSKVRIKVYDILGREIVVLVSEDKERGSYTVEWNAEEYASGIYFYSLQVGGFIETKKMMVIR